MVFFRSFALVFALCSLWCLPATGAEPAPVNASPPTLLEGKLPNGLRYFVLPQSAGSGRVSLRLVVHAGSLDEHDDELGFAHFVEHMAFNGTRHYPPGKLVQFFQRHGLAIGPDVNAKTLFSRTTYKIDLPAGHAADVGEALQVLRDFADGIAFDPAEVRREKGVILSELSARNTDEFRQHVQFLASVYAGTALPTRLPTGEPTSVEAVTAAGLRKFYQRCYRAERMTLVLVGDLGEQKAARLIGENFASLPPPGSPGMAPPESPSLAGGPLRAHVITGATLTAADVVLVAVIRNEPDTPTKRENDLAASVVMRLLNRRLEERRTHAAQRFGDVDASLVDGPDALYTHLELEAQASSDDWAAAVELLENELRRAREAGFTAAEISEATTASLATMRAERDAMPGETPDELADRLAATLASGGAWHDAAFVLAEAETYLPRFTPAMAANTLHSLFADERTHLVVSLSQPLAGGAETVLAAYRAAAAKPLAGETAGEADELRFRYEFGTPGAIASRRTEKDLQLELVKFANGVRLNLRSNPIEPHHFSLIARVGRGYFDVPPDKPGILMLATALAGESDFGHITHAEIGRLIRLRAIDASVSFSSGQCLVNLDGPAAELPFALQFLAAFLSDLKLEESHLPQALSSYGGISESLLNTSENYAKMETYFRLTGNDPRFQIPPMEKMAELPYAELAAWMRTSLLQGALEIGVTGDFDVDATVNAAAVSLGKLPPRAELPVTEKERLHFPSKPYRHVTDVPLADETATVNLMWPAKDAADSRTFYALQLATSGLLDRLRSKLRQELGVTYSPEGGVNRERGQRDFAFATVQLTFAPDKALDFANRAMQIADEFSRHGFTKEEFSRLREPLRAEAAENLRGNGWWLQEVLTHAQSEPAVLADARTLASIFNDLTREEVNRIAASHFRSSNAQVVGIVPRASSTPTTAPASPEKK